VLKPITVTVIFLGSLILMVPVACQKAVSPVPVPITDSVSAMVNDSSISFNAEVTVDSSSTPGTIYIIAHSDLANFTPLLEITIISGSPLKTGVYSDTPGNGGQGLLGYTAWNGFTDYQYYDSTDMVTINSVSKTSIAGTFQGTCQYIPNSQTDSSAVTETVTITNGRFNVGLGR
jgi:hypothetical protein